MGCLKVPSAMLIHSRMGQCRQARPGVPRSLEEQSEVVALCMLREVIPQWASVVLHHTREHLGRPLAHIIAPIPQHRHHDLPKCDHSVNIRIIPSDPRESILILGAKDISISHIQHRAANSFLAISVQRDIAAYCFPQGLLSRYQKSSVV